LGHALNLERKRGSRARAGIMGESSRVGDGWGALSRSALC
jgi:hypothetical protein